MKDQRVGRINHAECNHPQTKHEMRLCRQRKIEAHVAKEARKEERRRTTEKKPAEPVVTPSPTTYITVVIDGERMVVDPANRPVFIYNDEGSWVVQVGSE